MLRPFILTMEIQNRLFDYDESLKFENIKHLDMKPNPKSLETGLNLLFA